MSRCQLDKPKKRNYPAKRKKANRTRESYRARTLDGRAKQLEGLKKGRGKRRKFHPKPEPQLKPSWDALVKQKLDKATLYKMNIVDFATDCLGIKPYPAQEVILRAFYGLPMNLDQVEVYKRLTDTGTVINSERTEGVFILGARSGKSFLASIIALYEGVVRADRWRRRLNPGETGYIIIVATRLQQAQNIIGRCTARMMENSRIPSEVAESWATELALKNGITITSMPCNSTAGRGLPICGLILDELGWYKLEGSRADEEVFSALRPRMAQFRGAKFLAISTPASKQGLLWQLYDEGQVPGRLTVKATTAMVNPEVDLDFLESEKRRNPDNYAREFLAEFCESVDAFFPADKLTECFSLLGDVAPDSRYRYFAACDQSGLSGRDRFAMSIAHSENKKVIVDLSRTWATKDGDAIIAEIAAVLKPYGVTGVSVDRYAGGWVRNAFERQGLEVAVRDPLPAVYVNMKSLVISRRVELPDSKGLREGLLRTQVFFGRSNQLSISHERTTEGHGDEADSVATAVWLASSQQGGYFQQVL